MSRTSEEGLDHPQIVHNGDAIAIDDPVHGPVRQVGPIAHFSDSPCRIELSAPALGANLGPVLPSPGPTPGTAEVVHTRTSPRRCDHRGVRLLYCAMPYGLTMAAALGARVIKIEDRAGDPHRMSFGPEVASMKTTRGKESVSINLHSPEGRAVAHGSSAAPTFSSPASAPVVADKLGLGYEELKAINPRLVYVHAAGYGTDGPYAHRALTPRRPRPSPAASAGRSATGPTRS